jgi:hypothetical protein
MHDEERVSTSDGQRRRHDSANADAERPLWPDDGGHPMLISVSKFLEKRHRDNAVAARRQQLDADGDVPISVGRKAS